MCLQQLGALVDLALPVIVSCHMFGVSVSPCNTTHGQWVGKCVWASEVTEAHSSVSPKSTTAHLDLTQTALFANKNTLS